MTVPIKILHIDPDFNITYFIFRSGASIQSSVPIQQAVQLLKTEEFDLILSEPHNKAIMKNQAVSEETETKSFSELKQREKKIKEVYSNGKNG